MRSSLALDSLVFTSCTNFVNWDCRVRSLTTPAMSVGRGTGRWHTSPHAGDEKLMMDRNKYPGAMSDTGKLCITVPSDWKLTLTATT